MRMTRRNFISVSFGAGLTTILKSRAGEGALDPAGVQRAQYSASSLLFRNLSLAQACERIGRLGFDALDIWSGYEGCPHLDAAATEWGAEKFRETLARHRLRLGSFSTYVGGYAKYAALLGAMGGGVAIQGSEGPCPPDEVRGRMKRFLESLKPLVDLAERDKSFLAIENHENSLLSSLDSIKAFVDLNASPRLGVALAPYHLQAGQISVPEAIAVCGRQLFFFYAWQHAKGLEQLPGIGPTDFRPWLQALGAAQYRGYINPFLHGEFSVQETESNLQSALSYLRTKAV